MTVLCSDKTGTLTTADMRVLPHRTWTHRMTKDDALLYACLASNPANKEDTDGRTVLAPLISRGNFYGCCVSCFANISAKQVVVIGVVIWFGFVVVVVVVVAAVACCVVVVASSRLILAHSLFVFLNL